MFMNLKGKEWNDMHIILEYTFSMKPEETADFVDTASSCTLWLK